MTQPQPTRRALGSWMLFDWAAQPFFTVVLTFIFAPYFVTRVASDPVVGQASWANAIALGGFLVAIFSPILGTLADCMGPRKPWLLVLAIIKIAALTGLWWVVPGADLWLPMALIVTAMVAAEFSIVFNDSLLPSLASPARMGRLSNYAWGLGYLGGLVALFIVLLLLAESETTGKTLLGIDSLLHLVTPAGEDARITGPLAALWYGLFLIPLFLFTPDVKVRGHWRASFTHLGAELRQTLRELGLRTGLRQFLLARMIYQDGVNGLLALGGAFAAIMFGWQTIEVGVFGILLLLTAIAGCALAAWLDKRVDAKRVVLWSLAGLVVATLGVVSTGPGFTLFGGVTLAINDGAGLFATAAEKVYVAFGLLIGFTFGPVQASSRALLAQSVTADEAGRWFGIYALSGRATAFLAPMSVAFITTATESARAGMAALLVFLVVGFFMLWFTPYPLNRR